MGLSYRRTSTTTKEQDMSTGPRLMVGFFRLAMRTRIGKRSKPEDEYIGRPRGDGAESAGGHEEAWEQLSATGGGTGGGLGEDRRALGRDKFS